ncbi:MAG: hypothetical protein OET79_04955, partial [Nitrospirota bacterium]|nr:hypothetical protein [Nitrospirota bacterium]
TLRTEGATRINAGDVLVAFRWTGRPYRSKQEVIGEFVIDSVAPVTIGPDSVRLAPADFNPPEVITAPEELEKFAVADGFEKWADFAAYFNLTRQGEPGVTRETGHNFRGLLIKWL